jgi:hypothetical protein
MRSLLAVPSVTWLHLAVRIAVFLCVLPLVFGLSVAQDSPALPSLGERSEPVTSDAIATRIDREIQAALENANVVSVGVCVDEDFLRRVMLDLVGRIPTLAERATFLQDASPDKRLRLIDGLLASEDYVQHFSDVMDSLLMGRVSRGKMAERRAHWRPYLERVFRENRAWDQVAREILLARPENAEQTGAVWFLYERNDNAQAIAEAVAPAFFGIRIDCAQCHDHMVASDIHQAHYWGLVAFFNRSKNQKTNAGPKLSESAVGGFSDFANIHGSSYPNLLTFYESKTIEEPRPEKDAKQEDLEEFYVATKNPDDPKVPKFSRRERFVEEVFKGHRMVPRAFVNRLWAMLMGRGIVHPFDQMDSAHDPSHPALLDGLSEDFIASGYDIRTLVRGIVASRPYQLSSVRPEGVEDPSTFAWALEKSLTAEQLARSIQVALNQSFKNDHPLFAELRDRMPEVMPETIVTDVGDAMFLTNNPAMHAMVFDNSNTEGLAVRLAKHPDVDAAIREMFLSTLIRQPDVQELEMVRGFVTRGLAEGDTERVETVWRNAIWALLTTAEFRFNH